MRYRAQDQNGDMTFGAGSLNFYIDKLETVAQSIKTRLLLGRGEWFLDAKEGTPYPTEVLGNGTASLYDPAIRRRILKTDGVTEILAYRSSVDNRALSVETTVQTIYGPVTIAQVF